MFPEQAQRPTLCPSQRRHQKLWIQHEGRQAWGCWLSSFSGWKLCSMEEMEGQMRPGDRLSRCAVAEASDMHCPSSVCRRLPSRPQDAETTGCHAEVYFQARDPARQGSRGSTEAPEAPVSGCPVRGRSQVPRQLSSLSPCYTCLHLPKPSSPHQGSRGCPGPATGRAGGRGGNQRGQQQGRGWAPLV